MTGLLTAAPSASELVRLGLVVLGSPAVVVAGVLVVARVWRSRERLVLLCGCAVAGFALVGSFFSCIALGGNDAKATIWNRTPWLIAVSTPYDEPELIPPNQSKELVSYGGPGWFDGALGDVEILGGPDRATRILISQVPSGEPLEVVITEAALISAPGE